MNTYMIKVKTGNNWISLYTVTAEDAKKACYMHNVAPITFEQWLGIDDIYIITEDGYDFAAVPVK